MTSNDDDLLEKMVDKFNDLMPFSGIAPGHILAMRAALDIARPIIEREALEKAARVVDGHSMADGTAGRCLVKRKGGDVAGLVYADAIRALIPRDEEESQNE